ncbi:MAG: hypothetical protein J7K46_03035 [Bacteroidales bacterium]|nr:hypothetical protein [Bacteroidales bacterium]
MIKYQYDKKIPFSLIAIGIVLLLVFIQVFEQKRYMHDNIIVHDALVYYAPLPAVFIYHDLSFSFIQDLPERLRGKISTMISPDGKRTLKMPVGVSLLILPFFLLAHIIALLTGMPADGYGPVYQFFVLIAGIFYLTFALGILRKILCRWFNDPVTAITLLLIGLATNLFYYVSVEPGMSHVYSFFLFSGFLRYTIRWYESPGYGNAILLALFGGLILIVRPSNAVVFLVPVLYGLVSARSAWFVFLWKKRDRFLVMLPVLFAVVFIQLLYWKYSTGKWIFYSYGEERFFFNHPHVLKGLFSFRKGWLVYTPVMIFALTGFIFLYKKSTTLFWAISIYILINLYVVFSWWCWWYGGSFGARPLIETYALLALPLAACIEKILQARLWLHISGLMILGFFIYLNLFQIRQYRISMLHWDSTSKALYRKIFLSNKWPENYKQLLKHPDYQNSLKTGEE